MEEEQQFDPSVLEPTSDVQNDPKNLETILAGREAYVTVVPTTEGTNATEAAKGSILASENPQDTIGIYQNIMNELNGGNGFSRTLNDIKKANKENSAKVATMAAANALVDGSFDEIGIPVAKSSLMQTHEQIADERLNVAFAVKSASTYVPKSKDFDAEATVGIGSILQMEDARSRVQAHANTVVAEFDPNFGSFVGGVTQSILPFVESEQTRRMMSDLAEKADLDNGRALKSFLLTGEVKEEFRNTLEDLMARDPQAGEEMATSLLSVLRDNTNVIYENDFSSYNRLMELFGYEDGEYTKFDKYLDDAGGILDIVGAGGIAREAKGLVKAIKAPLEAVTAGAKNVKRAVKPVKRFLKGGRPEDIAKVRLRQASVAKARSEALKNSVVNSTAPTSPGKIAADYNPEQTRAMTEMALSGEGDESLALFGVSKSNKGDIASDAYLPQMSDADGNLLNKVSLSQADPIKEVLESGDVSRLSVEEMAQIEKKIQDGFRGDGVEGIKLSDEMTTIDTAHQGSFDVAPGVTVKSEGDVVKVTAAFRVGQDVITKNPEGLLNYFEWAFRNRGLSRDSVGLFKRVGSKWVEVDKEAAIVAHKATQEAKVASKVATSEGAPKQADLFTQTPAQDIPASADPEGKVVRERILNATKLRNDMKAKMGGRKSMTDEEIETLLTGDEKALSNYKQLADDTEDYLVVIKHKERAVFTDTEEMSQPVITNNMLDRIFARYNGPAMTSDWGIGSLAQHLFDAASLFKSHFIYRAASNNVDRAAKVEKLFLDNAREFSDIFNKLPKADKSSFVEWVEKANSEGLKFSPKDARLKGWSEDAIQAHHHWRAIWDRVYVLENADKVKSEKARKSKMWVDVASGESQLVKPVARSRTYELRDGNSTTVRAYNSLTGEFEELTDDALTELYKNGGELVTARRPVQTEKGVITTIISDNRAGKSYTRAIRDDERLLAYREGYFSRTYKDNYFIRKSIKDDKGKHLYWKAVGSTDNLKSARALNEQFISRDLGAAADTYVISEDIKRGSDVWEDAMHDLHTAGGRSAQKMRGEQLEKDLTADKLELATTANPMEAIVNSIRSISRRTSMRDWFETSKGRLLERYEGLMPRDPVTQQIVYPSKASDIRWREAGLIDTKKVADARTLFNYIRSMEDGYTNFIDDGWKGMLNYVANTFGSSTKLDAIGLAVPLEKAARYVADSRGPIQAIRTTTSIMVLFSNMLRQVVIQPAQSLQLIGIMHPQWSAVYSGPQVGFMISKYAGIDVSDKMLKMAGWTRAEYDLVFKQFEKTGQLAAVDKQNLVRGVLGDMADRAVASKFKKVATAPIHFMRKYGIDKGEMLNSLVTYLAFADQAKRAGKNLADPRVAEEVSSAARSFSGGMNEAGDMPYNHNIFSIPMQFAQIGHKMLWNMSFNQNLTPWQKGRLALVNLGIFGYPMQEIYEKGLSQYLPEDPELRQVVKEGLLNWGANESIKFFFDSNTRLDISGSVSPFSSSLLKTISSMVSSDLMTTIGESASGSLIFGNNPKIQTFARELSQWIVPKDDLPPAEFRTVALAGAKMFSGFSSAYKSAYIFQTGQTLSSKGVTSDYHADYVAAVAAIFGFRTQDEVGLAAFNTLSYEDKDMEEDMKKTYDNFARHVAIDGSNVGDENNIKAANAIGFSVYGSTPKMWSMWQKLVFKGATKGELDPLVNLYKKADTVSLDDVKLRLEMLPQEQQTPDVKRFISDLEKLQKNGKVEEE